MSPPRSIARRLFDLAAPVIGLNVLNVLSLAIDTAMCGRLPNSREALAALSYATQVVFVLMVLMMGLTVGTVALVARAYGAGDEDRVNHILAESTMSTIALGLLVGTLGNLLADPIMSAVGASAEVRGLGLEYLRPLLAGTVFYYLNILFGSVLRGVGNTRLAFFVALLSTGVNVALNYVLILGNLGFPALGVRGAAYGTVIAYAVGVLVMLLALRRGAVRGIRPSLARAWPDRALARQLGKIGAPAALDMVIINVAFLSIVGMLARVEETAVAAHGIGLRIQALAFVPGLAISQATGAMVGNALGAGDPAEARAVLRASIALCTAIMGALAILIISFVHPIIDLFDVERGTRLYELSAMWIRLLGVIMPVVGTYISIVGLLQGAGATNTSLRINLFVTLIQVPASAVLGLVLGWGAFGVWVAFPAAFVLKAALGAFAYRRGDWAKTGLAV